MRRVILVLTAIVLSGWTAPATEKKPQALPKLELVSRFALPEREGRRIVDIRWAGKDSVYLADLDDGVTEVRLEQGLPDVRRVTPPAPKVGLQVLRNIAISDKWVVVAHLGLLVWKAADDDTWHRSPERGYVHSFDISGDELIILGSPPDKAFERAPGGVVWRSDLSKGLAEWEPLYESKEVARNFDSIRLEAAPGSVRFLPRGGFLVAPNFVPGVLRFSSSGALKERLTPAELGISVAGWKAEGDGEPVRPKDLRRFLGSQSSIEVVLPLPEGPAIVVREPKGDGARYRLAVLGPEIQWYDIPIKTEAATWLRGDADKQGRIVLMGVERMPNAQVSSDVFVFRLPQ